MLDNGYFYELHHFIDLFCECCVNGVEPELGLVLRRNKITVVLSAFHHSYQFTEPHALPISASEGRGLDELKKALEGEIVNSTGKHILDLKVDLSTPQLR